MATFITKKWAGTHIPAGFQTVSVSKVRARPRVPWSSRSEPKLDFQHSVSTSARAPADRLYVRIHYKISNIGFELGDVYRRGHSKWASVGEPGLGRVAIALKNTHAEISFID